MVAHNLPVQPTSFVGRTHELDEAIGILDNRECRLLTLVGPGGIGKTRLALETAAKLAGRADVPFPDGVYFVPLQPLNSPDFILSALVEALGLQFYQGAEPEQQIFDYLRNKTLLLVLDNFEHLLDGVGVVPELLSNAPNVKIVATSRETLNLQEEWLYQVKGLRFPETRNGDLESYGAVQLFVQSARRVWPDFSLDTEREAVIQICQLVEGMPLALEMTATWLKRLPMSDIIQQLERGLDILESSVRNIPARHRSMRVVFEHSWNSLNDAERDVFMKLSIFRGGFCREAAESVAGATIGTLAALVDKSLVTVDQSGRYDLHELVRQYADDQLSLVSSRRKQTRDRHGAYYLDFLGERVVALGIHSDQNVMADISAELKNVRQAYDWMIEQNQTNLDATICLVNFYGNRCLYREGEELFARHEAKLREQPPGPELAHVICNHAWMVELGSQEYGKAAALFEEALTLARQFPESWIVSDATLRLSTLNAKMGDYERARQLGRESLASQESLASDDSLGDADHWRTWMLANLGNLALLSGDYAEAQELLEEAIACAIECDQPYGIADARNYLGQVKLALKEYAEAEELFADNLSYQREIDYRLGEVVALLGLGEATYGLGDHHRACQYFTEALRIAMHRHQIPNALHALLGYADLLVQEEKAAQALELAAFVLGHHAVTHELKTRATTLHAQLEVQISPQAAAMAIRLASSTDLENIIQKLLDSRANPQSVSLSALQPEVDALTERELEILHLIADGLSNAEIAQKLYLSVATVKVHARNIYAKLDVSSRTQAIAQAQRLKLL